MLNFSFSKSTTMTSLLTMGMLLHSSQAALTKPMDRYTPWASVKSTVRAAAQTIGYSETSWNKFSQSIEAKSWFTINQDSPELMDEVAIIGINEESWDCYINRYSDYFWSELSLNAQQAASTLGWNENSWDKGGSEPASEDKDWSELSAAEKSAAGVLCYDQQDWDGIPLNLRTSAPVSLRGSLDSAVPLCFSGENMVEVQGLGMVSMEKLQIGNYVKVANGEFSRIYTFLHFDRNTEAEYLQIHAKGLTSPLEISHDHMLFVDGKATRAKDVKPGDMLGQSEVLEIQTIKRRGIYNPGTEAGNIVVSGILASSYPAVFDLSTDILQLATHSVLSPLRLVCSIKFDFCRNETHTEGLTDHYFFVHQIVSLIQQFATPLQLGTFVLFAPLLIAARMLEQVILSPSLFTSISAAFLGYRAFRLSKQV